MPSPENITITCDTKDIRLDKYLASVTDIPRAKIQKLIAAGLVAINGIPCIERDNKRLVQEGEIISVTDIDLTPPSKLEPNSTLDFSVVYEDDDLLVINKPAGLTVHPGAGNYQDTLVNGLLARSTKLAAGSAPDRPGIVHRLDKDTSGLMVVAKTDHALSDLARQLSSRTLSRSYLALVWGIVQPISGTFTTEIARSRQNYEKMQVVDSGGKLAITHYELLENFSTLASLVEARLETGRTHQIRVHFNHHGYPLIGDQLYGRARKILNLSPDLTEKLSFFKRQALHAAELGFIHPSSGKEMHFVAEPPADFMELLETLRGWQRI